MTDLQEVMERARRVAEGMTDAHRQGLTAGRRGWATLSDLQLAESEQPGWADAYRMGVELGRKELEQQEGRGA